MKKKISVIAYNENTLNELYNHLLDVFDDIIEFRKYQVYSYQKIEDNDSDLIVISGHRTYGLIKDKLEGKKFVISTRYINYSKLEVLSELKDGTSLYVVNDQEYSAHVSIKQLIDIGCDYDFHPFYPGLEGVDESIRVAITIGEPTLVPKHVEEVYDIGARVFSISTITNIATTLGLSGALIDKVMYKYMYRYVKLLKRNKSNLDNIYNINQIMNSVFDDSKEGMVVVNHKGEVITTNSVFLKMTGLTMRDFIGKNFYRVLEGNHIVLDVDTILNTGVVIRNHMDKEILINASTVKSSEDTNIIFYASYSDDVWKKEMLIRRETNKNTTSAKYSFNDYITKDCRCKRMVSRAKKIALSDSCVLIQGESGTGKEILAQSIHNVSKRRNESFVAVNFAAIQPNLLESELFGYVEGSFTGAKKGGSKGLFEKAHKGTLFIDEIGDAPLSFQIRLLRVLQEKEIRRVGDSDRIPVDVRVIVATNKDLISLVEKGEFREDLFFRINVMPVDVPALRERKGDIELLLNHYLRIYKKKSSITIYDMCTERLVEYLLSYNWKGNIRELINLIEYFTCIKGSKKLDYDDIPKYMKTRSNDELILTDIDKLILGIIAKNPRIGRYKICEELKVHGYDIKEGKVRGIIKELKEKELIVVNNTRGGCEVSHKALKLKEFMY